MDNDYKKHVSCSTRVILFDVLVLINLNPQYQPFSDEFSKEGDDKTKRNRTKSKIIFGPLQKRWKTHHACLYNKKYAKACGMFCFVTSPSVVLHLGNSLTHLHPFSHNSLIRMSTRYILCPCTTSCCTSCACGISVIMYTLHNEI